MPGSLLIALEAIEDVAKIALVVVGLYLALAAYVRRRQPTWGDPVERRRTGLLLLFAFAAAAIKLSEDALSGESGPIDRAILLFIHGHVPRTLDACFSMITFSGSSDVLAPLALLATLALLIARRRLEALLIGGSTLSAAMIVFAVKTAVGRVRPALWDTQWYWGSSFPSGHSLVVAAFATGSALCVGRIWPAARGTALGVALGWTVLVALSRLVLGAHWPTDVLVAACVGAAVPHGLNMVLDLLAARTCNPARRT